MQYLDESRQPRCLRMGVDSGVLLCALSDGYGRQHSVLLVRHGEPDPQIRRSELAGGVDSADGAAAAELGIYGADRAQGTQVIAELPIGRKRTVSIS